jgi:quercetin dioxygenase-like cupin family protein
MGLMQLGERTGLSPALLSKIENSKLVPTVPTLLRIALVFDVTLDHLFHNEHRNRVISITRKEQREQAAMYHPRGNDPYDLMRLDMGNGDRQFQPFLVEFLPETESNVKSHMHQGFEFIHILSGSLQLLIGADESTLRAGDSIYFDSNLRHAYKRIGKEKCTAFMVFAYPEKNLAERRMDRLEGVHAVRQHAQPQMNGKPQLLHRTAAATNGELRENKALQQSA